jgi:ribosomal protein L37E/uncharacterized protein YkwD
MPLSDRDFMKGDHPPACTCVDCVNKRLKKLGIKPRKQTKYSKDERNLKFTYLQKKQESVKKETPSHGKQPIDEAIIKRCRMCGDNTFNIKTRHCEHCGWNEKPTTEQPQPKLQPQPEYHPPTLRLSTTDKQSRVKHEYPRDVRIIANIILSLIVIFAIVLLGGGIYGISKYHGNAWNWVSQEYHSLANNIVNLKDKTTNSVSNIAQDASNSIQSAKDSTIASISSDINATTAIQPTNNAPQSSTTNPSQTPTVIDKASNVIKSLVVNNTDVSDYAIIFNQYRQSKGCAPLIFTDDLNRIAILRLSELKTNFSHSSQYNRYLAENIIKGVANNQEALYCWEDSYLHNANMIDTTYKNTGYAAGSGYAVQVFSKWDTINGIPQLPPGWYFAK